MNELPPAPKRHVFYIDVGSMDPKEALAYLEKVREEYKRKREQQSND
jgi:hypothetical protein